MIFPLPSQLFPRHSVRKSMNHHVRTGLLFCCGALVAASVQAQQAPTQPAPQNAAPQAVPDTSPVPLEWTPPALTALSAQASLKDSFTLDRNMLHLAVGLLPNADEPTRESFNKLDGVSVHLLRFGNGGPDEAAVNSIRESYHLRGWKHFVTTSSDGGPVHNGHTDVWTVLDGMNVRGVVFLAETPRSVTLVTVAGNLSPVDILHLRGHFGIPKFDDPTQR